MGRAQGDSYSRGDTKDKHDTVPFLEELMTETPHKHDGSLALVIEALGEVVQKQE